MRKRNLILPLFLSSLFMPTTLDAALFDLYKSNNNQKSDLLIASPGGHSGNGGGGGGGGQKPGDKEATQKKRQPAQDAAKRRISCKKNEIDCSKKGVESNKKEKIAISKLDTDLGVGHDYIKDETKELTAKIAIASISNISARIVKLKDQFRNYNPTSLDDFFKKADEIKSKIKELEELQDKIDDFINFNIDNVVNILSLFDQFADQFADEPVNNAEVVEKSNEFGSKFSSLVEELKAAGIYDDELRQTPGTIESYLYSMHRQTQQYFKKIVLLRFLKR